MTNANAISGMQGSDTTIAVIGDPQEPQITSRKAFAAVVDVDREGQLYGVEILWLKDQIGLVDLQHLIELLKGAGITFTYDDEVDILHFAATSEVRSVDQAKWNAELAFRDQELRAFYLRLRPPPLPAPSERN